MFEELKNKRVVVTGSTGFIGKHVINLLDQCNANYVGLNSKFWNMIGPCSEAAGDVLYKADHVLHLAGYNGGIEFNIQQPATIYSINSLMALNLFVAAHCHSVKKLTNILASCAYGNMGYNTLYETQFLIGEPHYSVRGHGLAKRNLLTLCQLYYDQFKTNAVCLIPTTVYGPGNDFRPEHAKVVGSLIAKFVQAKRNGHKTVGLLGTGNSLREFIYVEDAAKYILLGMLKYDQHEVPLNIGSGQELSIKELAEKIAKLTGFKGNIYWDVSHTDGQLRKRLATDRQFNILGELPLTPLDEGLAKTVEDYERSY